MRLTVRTLLLAALVGLLAGADLWLQSPLGLWRWFLLLVVGALAFEGLHARQRPLRLEAGFDGGAPRLGVPVRFAFTLHNEAGSSLVARHRLLPSAALERTSGDVVGRVAAFDCWCFDAAAVPRRLGPDALPDQWIEVSGAFGLAQWTRRVAVDLAFTVAPMLARDGDTAAGGVADGLRGRPVRGIGAELLGLRPYRSGDPARRIDWKATARSGRPVVREYEQDEAMELLLVVDAGLGMQVQEGNLTRFGHACNAAARLAERAARRGDRVGLLVYADTVLARLAPARGTGQLARLRDALAASDARAAESNPMTAVLGARHLLSHRALVAVFTELDDPDGSEQLVGAVRLLRPVHLPLIVALLDEESHALPRAPATNWRDPWYAIAAQEAERETGIRRLRLRRLGAEVVHAPQAEIDDRVLERYETLRFARRV